MQPELEAGDQVDVRRTDSSAKRFQRIVVQPTDVGMQKYLTDYNIIQ